MPRQVETAQASRPEGLTLAISDDGCGIPSAAMGTSTGLGLRTMRARAAALGGKLVLSSTASGTSVPVTVPRQGPADA